MPQPPRPKFTLDLPSTGGGERSRRTTGLGSHLCQTADLVILSAAFLSVVVILPLFHGDTGRLIEILQLRFSLRNVLIGGLCLSTWRTILVSVGVYSAPRTRSVPAYLLRCLVAINSCTAVVGLVEVVLRKPQNVWHSVGIFWLSAFVLMSLVRGMLVLFNHFLPPVLRRKGRLMILSSSQRARD